MDLFSQTKQHFKLPNAELVYYPSFLSQGESNTYFNYIASETKWRHDDIMLFGKSYKQPRLTALFGDSNQPYSYSNVVMQPEPFSETLLLLKSKIETKSHHNFNTVLINLYRNGSDSNGWHADNEKELGKNPVIASLSLGEERPFHFKHRHIKDERHKLVLEHGSLLIMKGEMQEYWLHQIAKTKRKVGPRINLTFRKLVTL